MIRRYHPQDLNQIAKLFYETVHTINIRDYSQKQVDVWASGKIDFKDWNRSFLQHYSIVVENNGMIAGFGDFDAANSYIDRLYVHKDCQGQGIGTQICNMLEKQALGSSITVHASITARPFFEMRGYKMIKEQQVDREGILLTNFVMKKYCQTDSPFWQKAIKTEEYKEIRL